MNEGNVKIGKGRTGTGIVLGALLAAFAPLTVMTEVVSLLPVLLWPSVALVALYRWAGRGPALFSALLMLVVDSLFMPMALMLAMLAATILPSFLLLRVEDRPFFQQMRYAIAGFGAGAFAAVVVLFLGFGGNMIERALSQVPQFVRMVPAEGLSPVIEMMSRMLGRAIALEDFYALYDAMIVELIPLYQARLLGLILSGALITALVCTWISNRMRERRVNFKPLREWALPASTTSGLLLIFAVSLLMRFAKIQGADSASFAVSGIVTVAFCTQMLASMARRAHLSPFSIRRQRTMLIVTLALCILGAAPVAAVFGCASAIFGSRGLLQQRMQNMNNDDRDGGEE